MRIVEQSCKWIQELPADALQVIERAGRTCYKSEAKITADSAAEFVRRIMTSGHASVIEHVSASMLFVTDRGVTHEQVRHRVATIHDEHEDMFHPSPDSYSQESTRYCNYSRDGFGGEVTYVDPVFWMDRGPGGKDEVKFDTWFETMQYVEKQYLRLIAEGATAQEARSVLPNSLKTEIVMTANMREWRHFFTLRTATAAHPQMRDLACKALVMFKAAVPVLFDDIVPVAV